MQEAFAVIAAGEVRLITALNNEIDALGAVVAEHFGNHPDADIYVSQPGLGVMLGARVLAEFGDDPARYAYTKARQELRGHVAHHAGLRNHAGGPGPPRKKRQTRRRRPTGGLRSAPQLPWSILTTTPCEPAKIGHDTALRQLANRLVGILHDCMKTRTTYSETTAWAHIPVAA